MACSNPNSLEKISEENAETEIIAGVTSTRTDASRCFPTPKSTNLPISFFERVTLDGWPV